MQPTIKFSAKSKKKRKGKNLAWVSCFFLNHVLLLLWLFWTSAWQLGTSIRRTKTWIPPIGLRNLTWEDTQVRAYTKMLTAGLSRRGKTWEEPRYLLPSKRINNYGTDVTKEYYAVNERKVQNHVFQHESQKHTVEWKKQLGKWYSMFPFTCTIYTKKIPVVFI